MSITKETADLIFNKLFFASVPYLQSLTDEEIEVYGIPFVNDKEYDDMMQNQQVRRYMTINDMVEYQVRGVPIRLLNYDDAKEIYDIVNRHLLAFKTRMDQGIFNSAVPHDDLVALDNLANTLYPYARHHQQTQAAKDSVLTKTDGLSLFSLKPIIQSRPNNQGRLTINDTTREFDPEEQRQSLTDTFEEARVRREYTVSNNR